MVTELGTSDLCLEVETGILTKGGRRKKPSPAESPGGREVTAGGRGRSRESCRAAADETGKRACGP